jgi:DNA-binding transcriptional MerR regulator
MEASHKNRWVVFTIALLVILNVATLSFMWIQMAKEPPRPGRTDAAHDQERIIRFFKEELGLNDKQIKVFLQHRENHRIASERILADTQHLKQEMFNELFHEQPDTAKVERLIDEIGEKQKEMERLTFNYFAELKQLCGERQQERLQKLLDEFFREHAPPSGGPAPPDRRPPPDRRSSF